MSRHLWRMAGNDALVGGPGADKFVFNAPLNENNVDRIMDYVGSDVLRLDSDIFPGLGTGTLAPGRFHSAPGAHEGNDAGDRIIYDSSSGGLYFDADGSGPAAATLFAFLSGVPLIGAGEFFIIN